MHSFSSLIFIPHIFESAFCVEFLSVCTWVTSEATSGYSLLMETTGLEQKPPGLHGVWKATQDVTYRPNRLGSNLPRCRNWRLCEKAEIRASERERERRPRVRKRKRPHRLSSVTLFKKNTVSFPVRLGSNKTLRESDSHMETHHTDTRRCLATLPAPLFRNLTTTPCTRWATCPHTGAKTCANCCQSFHIPHLYSRDTHTHTGRSCWQITEQHSPSWISTADSAGWKYAQQ